ncbi:MULTISPECIES: MAB_1171c family putative transporter [Streptomyces]|uniref:MAB_1171c family putative transporter n=1 Tax=Streptomyces TaxID=1883 RepID=UPI00163CD202|nr:MULTISPECIES: MAB_1171c family putative transporter [Streptomyces]MBC2876892.1 hypothetical protein [Streptomyces sp. TYQ1024]UBI35920.1 hypothetical protein K7I03_05220 [Streptomyces mobaraensis]UKW28514.1 hypothetical protein MCU78_05220 [Streptomyces sp. TYQ1024]
MPAVHPSHLTAWCCATAALAALLYNVPVLLRSRGNPAVLALSVHFLCSFLGFFEQLTGLNTAVALLPGRPHPGPLVTELAVVGLTGTQTVFLTYWSHPPEAARPRVRRRVAVFAGMAVALVVLDFALGLGDRRAVADRLTLADMSDPAYAAYLYFFFTVCAAGQCETVRLSWRYMGIAQRSWLRRGMGAAMLGATLSLVHCALRCTEITGTLSGWDMTPLDTANWLTGDIGSALKVFGWTVPAWGPSLSRAVRWGTRYRAYRRLRPLWIALYRTVPDIVLDPPVLCRIGDLLAWRDLDYRLYRRVIEIRDGQRALRPYMPEPAPGDGDGDGGAGPGARSGAEREAYALWVAIRDKCASRAPRGAAAEAAEASDGRREASGLTDDIAWLVRVSDAFVRLR